MNDRFFAQSGEPPNFSFFQFLFLALVICPPFGESFVAWLHLELATERVNFFTGKGFLPTGHEASLHPPAGRGQYFPEMPSRAPGVCGLSATSLRSEDGRSKIEDGGIQRTEVGCRRTEDGGRKLWRGRKGPSSDTPQLLQFLAQGPPVNPVPPAHSQFFGSQPGFQLVGPAGKRRL